jgi:hypothetical protein
MKRMRILLDHCLDWRHERDLPGHEVKSAAEMGWGALKNGNLLAEAEGRFDVLLTVDQNLRYQQKMTGRQLAVVVLVAPNNARRTLSPLFPRIETLLAALEPGTVYEVVAVRTTPP